MTLAILYSRAHHGLQCPLITVETHLSVGIPRFNIVGLAETAVKESKDRVRSAIINSRFEFPARHITVNLAPADLPKESCRFDLPIALGILAASGQIPATALNNFEIAGELALSGEVRFIRGALPMALATQMSGRDLVIPKENSEEAKWCQQLTIFPVTTLLEFCNHLANTVPILPLVTTLLFPTTTSNPPHFLDIKEVKGHSQAKRAFEIAGAGNHSILMNGPPGTGKTMLAQCLTGILPAWTRAQALETAAIYSLANYAIKPELLDNRPFRSPHHTASPPALVGGGNPPRPGEISLAHHGILFLDELPEFKRSALESLREPLETQNICIARAGHQAYFPASFQLIAAMNPCPCGYKGTTLCQCTPNQIQHYQKKLSGPLLDRIDIHLYLLRQNIFLAENDEMEQHYTSLSMRERIATAQQRQLARQSFLNAYLKASDIAQFCALGHKSTEWLMMATEKFNLSSRSQHRLLRVARTIADLANCENIELSFLQEAFSLRQREDKNS